MSGDVPSFTDFDPFLIKWQGQFTNDIWNNYDYSKGVHQVLASGSVGSAKSLACVHNYLKVLLTFEKAGGLMGRLTMPDLKDTSIKLLLDHMEGDLVEGEDYEFNRTKQSFLFSNGSISLSRTWHKKNFKQFRSLKLNVAFIEELTENNEEHWPAYLSIMERLGRLPQIPMNLMLCATNPDSTSHPAFSYFIDPANRNSLKHVHFSLTEQNPFLPDFYIENLKDVLTSKEILRQLHGQWVDLDTEKVYYAYTEAKNYRDKEYTVDTNLPLDIFHDFNIGFEKPMSCGVGQYRNGNYHIFKNYVVQGARTEDIMEEMANDGLFEHGNSFRVFGDASGKNNDTRSIKTDYTIIEKFLSNYQRKNQSYLQFELCIPTKNPPIRKRHNLVNGKCENANGATRFYIYKTAPICHESMIKTSFKKGSNYLEDDGGKHPYQHIGTAIGYYLVENERLIENSDSKVVFSRR